MNDLGLSSLFHNIGANQEGRAGERRDRGRTTLLDSIQELCAYSMLVKCQ